jgi:uncharacterized protein (DUF1015 family)
MPEIKPFKGIRFNPRKIKNIADVITQPYDQITDEMEKEYKRRSPYSYVNLVLTHYADGHDRQKEYQDAKRSVEEWMKNGIFVRDEKESIYPYFQEFTSSGRSYLRKGFICRVRLEELGKDKILPHEKTLSKPKEDRLSLTRITKMDFEPVFLLYTDPADTVMKMIERECKAEPVVSVKDDRGILHRMWQISKKEVINRIIGQLKDSIFVIADGHHRYETALNFRGEHQDIGSDHPANFKMITLVNIQDQGLVILPTHRLAMNLGNFDLEAFLNKAGDFFTVRKSDRERVSKDLAGEQSHAFGFYHPSGTFILKLTDPEVMARFLADKSPAFQCLDVAILHTLLIENMLGIRPDKIEDHIRYQRGIEEALKRVDSGEFQFAFLMNPTRPEQVRDVAIKKERMPQKSTDFYPKLVSGLVLYDIG